MSVALHHQIIGSGPDITLLHGWAMNSQIWGPWAEHLAERYRVHLIDLPGFGKSPWPYDTLPDLQTYAYDLSEQLPDKTLLVGWSLGGLVAQSIASVAPDKASSLLLLNSSVCFHEREDWPCGTPSSILNSFSEQLSANHMQVLRDFVMLQCRSTALSDKKVLALYRQLIEHGTPSINALNWGIEMLKDVDHRQISIGIQQPQTWVFGSQDKIVLPQTASHIESLLPHACVHLIDRSAHLPFWSHPDVCFKLIEGLI